jgi:hypothetical protein
MQTPELDRPTSSSGIPFECNSHFTLRRASIGPFESSHQRRTMPNGQKRSATDFASEGLIIDMQTDSTQNILDNVPVAIKDYAVDLFWTHYNSVLHVVHKDAFLCDKNDRKANFYSPFLHLCIIVMGCKFSAHSDPRDLEIRKTGTVLRDVANLIADHLLQSSQILPTVQALLVLSDVEFGFGREGVGQKYLSMCFKLSHTILLIYSQNEC